MSDLNERIVTRALQPAKDYLEKDFSEFIDNALVEIGRDMVQAAVLAVYYSNTTLLIVTDRKFIVVPELTSTDSYDLSEVETAKMGWGGSIVKIEGNYSSDEKIFETGTKTTILMAGLQ